VGLEGCIDVNLRWDGRTILQVEVSSNRPLAACRVLEGKPWQESEALVPRLFSVCGRAQVVAAAGAGEAARGALAEPDVILVREWAIAAECLQEYAWRLLLDLPVLLGETSQPDRVAALRRELQPAPLPSGLHPWWHFPAGDAQRSGWKAAAERVCGLLAEAVFGVPPADWLSLDSLKGLEQWMKAGKTLPARHLWAVWQSDILGSGGASLPWFSADEAAAIFAGRMGGDDFIRVPERGGMPAETGALGRLESHPALAEAVSIRGRTPAVRLLARLVETARLVARLAQLAAGVVDEPWHRNAPLAAGSGFSVTETARGMLLHRVELVGDKVVRYRILAPTEWNFHPRGALAQGLNGRPAASVADAVAAARLLIHSLDPCVGCRVQVSHA
jgi:uptake hydrogenase large subunit